MGSGGGNKKRKSTLTNYSPSSSTKSASKNTCDEVIVRRASAPASLLSSKSLDQDASSPPPNAVANSDRPSPLVIVDGQPSTKSSHSIKEFLSEDLLEPASSSNVNVENDFKKAIEKESQPVINVHQNILIENEADCVPVITSHYEHPKAFPKDNLLMHNPDENVDCWMDWERVATDSKKGSLLRLFQSPLFTPLMALHYLARYPTDAGIQFYLCQRLQDVSFKEEVKEHLLPQLTHLVMCAGHFLVDTGKSLSSNSPVKRSPAVSTPSVLSNPSSSLTASLTSSLLSYTSNSIKTTSDKLSESNNGNSHLITGGGSAFSILTAYLVQLGSEDVHAGCQLLWLAEAYLQDALRLDNPQEVGRRWALLQRFQRAIFRTSTQLDDQNATTNARIGKGCLPDVPSTLVGFGCILTSLVVPRVNFGPLICPETTNIFSSSSPDNIFTTRELTSDMNNLDELNKHEPIAEHPAELPVYIGGGGASFRRFVCRAFKGFVRKPAELSAEKSPSINDDCPQKTLRPNQNPAASFSETSVSGTSTVQEGSPSDAGKTYDLLYLPEMHFVGQLVDISRRLLKIEGTREGRLKHLRQLLSRLKLPSQVCIPGFCKSHKLAQNDDFLATKTMQHDAVLRIVPEESAILNSSERCPFVIFVEILEAGSQLPDNFISNLSEVSKDVDKQSLLALVLPDDPLPPLPPSLHIDSSSRRTSGMNDRMHAAAVMLAQVAAHHSALTAAEGSEHDLAALEGIRDRILAEMEQIEWECLRQDVDLSREFRLPRHSIDDPSGTTI